jgi:mannosyltransferase
MKNSFLEYLEFNKRSWIILALLFFVTHLLQIDVNGIWFDEAFSVYHAQASIGHILNTCMWDINPPGYLIVLHYWIKWFGTSEFAIRSLSLVSFSLGISLLFKTFQKYISFDVALYTVIFLFFSNEIFYYSHEARGYGVIFLEVTLSLRLLFSILEKPNWLKVLLLGLLYGFMIYTHYLVVFIIFVEVLFFIIYSPKDFKYLGGFAAGSFIVLFHWKYRLFEIFLKKTGINSHKTWIPEPTYKDLVSTTESLFNNMWVMLLILGIGIALYLFILYKKITFSRKNYWHFTFLLSIGFGIILLHFFISRITPVWVIRYFLYSSIGIYAWFAFLLWIAPLKSKIKMGIVLGIVLVAFIPTKYASKPLMDYKNGVAFIKDSLQTPNSRIIVQSIDVSILFAYYYDKELFTETNKLLLYEHNAGIYCMNDTVGIYKLRIDTLQSVILTQTFQNTYDPEKILPSYLDSIFPHKKVYNNYPGFLISHYSK